jgi:hypothetical protein
MHDRADAPLADATVAAARASVSRDRVESPLSRVLRDYWRAQSSNRDSGVQRIGNAIAPARASRPDRAADPTAESPRQPLLREPLSRAVEPARGANAEPVASPRVRGAAAFTDRSLDAGGSHTADTPLAERAIATDWLTGDLADQLADILRDQAIREGIDLT